MRKIYIILFTVMVVCIGCELKLRPNSADSTEYAVIDRYDRLEHLYLSTGDVAAMQQMSTDYPRQTSILLEDLLRIGQVNDTAIKSKFLIFFQDQTLQTILRDVNDEFKDMTHEDQLLSKSFDKLETLLPGFKAPIVYTQIGSLDQSIVVDSCLLGISLDKYLGSEYPIYLRYGYSDRQRSTMTREYIVPDCLSFYLLSLYAFPESDSISWEQRHQHMGNIQHVVNTVLNRRVFDNPYVEEAESIMQHNPMTIEQLLRSSSTIKQ